MAATVRNMIGPQVRQLRSARQMTQEMLAGRLQRAGWDVSRVSVAKIESQLRWVADCELYLLAKVFDVAMEDFFPSEAVVKRFVGSPAFKRN
jgi:transcriptional regulator with XRE-family HTH domain